ncbi:MexE family multidrug efflux RND transporter per iplasmic adaptor subunit [Desulfonema ishimotonii]|uniref:MexE family multidrug efflux RND transporter per iplasmic adaptor subunit n=1 Tax=Desulfonema ishimotonii TaxID=45657 RepID=A0A401FQP4_9BACT|nr:efflux RND transporter periplasmic adaptor subunit [Desulfonema ishimotonii]GBC59225.1 MexE family multidrug efflux RND transporter per iplasmic adaptor subunit [Desulfonema ishimotonii]
MTRKTPNLSFFPLPHPLIVCFGIFLLILAGCNPQKNTYAPPPPPEVTVSTPVKKAVTRYMEFTGTTEAVESVEIRARVEGYLESINFTPSTKISKGDLLFVIDPRPYQAKLDQAKADLAIRHANLKLADATLKRLEQAYKTRAVSQIEVLEAQAKRDTAKAGIQAAEAAVESAELDLAYTRIHAPISGRIGRNLVDVGNLVGAAGDKTLLATIVNDDPVYAYFYVNERLLLEAEEAERKQRKDDHKRGKVPAFLGLAHEDGFPHEGQLDYIDNRVDPDTGTVQTRGVFPNPERILHPGLFARIRVPIGDPSEQLLVPERALGADQRGRFLLAVKDDNTVEYKPVRTGVLMDGLRVIREGISEKDRIVVNGVQRARPGIEVTPKTEGAEAETGEKSPNASE